MELNKNSLRMDKRGLKPSNNSFNMKRKADEILPGPSKKTKQNDDNNLIFVKNENMRRDCDENDEKIIDKISCYTKKLDYIIEMVESLINQLKSNNQPAIPDDDFFPEPIKDYESLKIREANLLKFDLNPNSDVEFKEYRNNLVKYYVPKLSNWTKSKKCNGLMRSLFLKYFDIEFIQKIGWTDVYGRFPVKNFSGHFSLFNEIINKHSPSTYSNLDECTKAFHKALRRFHETVYAEARQAKKAVTELAS